MAQIKIYEAEIEFHYTPKPYTGRVTALQANVTYFQRGARVTAMQADMSYSELLIEREARSFVTSSELLSHVSPQEIRSFVCPSEVRGNY